MTLITDSEIRTVNGISLEQQERICNFIQGAVYCWCKNRKDEWFSIRDLMGGENFNWEGTPLIVLYEKHRQMGKSQNDSVSDAGKDSGWLVKRVINDDQREFQTKKEDLVRKYRWIK